MEASTPADRVIEIVDGQRQDLVDLCLRLGNARDFAGDEIEVARIVEAWLSEAGIETRLQRLAETSANAVGTLRGTGERSGGARSLILNAHMDTQGVAPAAGAEEERRLRGAHEEDGLLFGNGLANDKAQLAAQMIAVRAIVRAGLRLRETLYVTGVAQETAAPPERGREIEGWSGIGPRMSQVREGHGARWLVEHGIVADYALVGEITDFRLGLGQTGYLRLRIAVPGHLRYTPLLTRGETPSDNPNPFERAAHVVSALEAWATDYERTDALDFGKGTIVPRAQVYEVAAGGLPFTEVSDSCNVFFDVRLVPGARPAEILDRVRRALGATGLDCEVSPYDYRRGYLAEDADPLGEALGRAHRHVFDEAMEFAESGPISTWRDTNAFNEAGIPAVCYGGRARSAFLGGGLAGDRRPMAVDDLLALSKVYALTALDLCGVVS
ncbi:MAG: M20/M25/M40 family metallo-hydrolase, partial [Defluviicoccus sp.]|nr:M20/M25/M40 family metallo-hydrolase [Defluviicoccus sp.]